MSLTVTVILSDGTTEQRELCPAACNEDLIFQNEPPSGGDASPSILTEEQYDAICNLFQCGPTDVSALATALNLMCEQANGVANIEIQAIPPSEIDSIGANSFFTASYVRQNSNKKILIWITSQVYMGAVVSQPPDDNPNLYMHGSIKASLNGATPIVVNHLEENWGLAIYSQGDGSTSERQQMMQSNTFALISDEDNISLDLIMEIDEAKYAGSGFNVPSGKMLLETKQPSQIIFWEV